MYENDNIYLFSQGNLPAVLREESSKIKTFVDEIPRDQFLVSSEDELIDYVLLLVSYQPLKIYEESIEMEETELRLQDGSQGIRITVSVPFTGSYILWKVTTIPMDG